MPARIGGCSSATTATAIRAAREALVQRFLPLARQLARRYQRGGEPLDDLIQVASLGLLKAIDRFEPERPTAFSSFAVPTILGELKRHFRDSGWSVRVPRDLQEMAVRVERVDRGARARARPRADAGGDRRAHRHHHRARARGARGRGRLPGGLARPPARRRRGRRRHRGLDGRRGPGLRPRRARRDRRAPDGRARATASARCCACASRRTSRSRRSATRVGVSQMHVSRLIRQAVARLREEAADERDVA